VVVAPVLGAVAAVVPLALVVLAVDAGNCCTRFAWA
jgi:hypothetical protein